MFKKILVGIAMIALISTPAMAFLDDNSVDNSTNAAAEVNDVSAGASVDDHSVNTSNNPRARFLPNPGMAPMPQTNGFFVAPTPDSSFRSIRELVKMDDPNATCLRVTEGTLEEWASGGDSDVNYQKVREIRVLARGNKADRKLLDGTTEEARWLNICIEMPKGFKTAAFVDGEADDGDTNMLNVLGKAGDKAVEDGVTTLVITAEGAHRSVEASGWGIGLYMLGSDVSKGGSTAGIMGGGTGYASNETQAEDNPWFQGKAGMVE